MVPATGALLAAVFAVLFGLHVYWAFGGRRGASAVLPQKSSNTTETVFTPPRLLTLVVAIALASAGAIELFISGVIAPPDAIAAWPRRLAFVVVAAFFLRAVGEFRYVGFFKRVRGTSFSRWDDRVFSPLCLFLSAVTLALALRE